MDTPAEKTQVAWQPLTPQGVAAFARGPLRRLFLVQLIFALLAAATAVWSLHHAWFPVFEQAISQLPPQGQIRFSKLDWRGDSPARLAENPLLAFSVDLTHSRQARSPAHVQVEFGQYDVRIFSLFGFLQGRYPPGWRMAFNRVELEPWWGAWVPELLACAAGSVLAGLIVIWAILATLHSLPAWLIGFFANRDLSLGGSWRLSGAALLPGALFLTAAIFLYGLGLLDLVRLLVAAGAHLVIGWVYLVVSPLALPRYPGVSGAKRNPFAREDPRPTQPAGEPPHAGTNETGS